MSKVHFIPECKHAVYILNDNTGWFEKQPSENPFNKLPSELKLQATKRTDIVRTPYLIASRVIQGKKAFFTGLDDTGLENWYSGDHVEQTPMGRKKSLVLFELDDTHKTIKVYFFNHFYKESPKERREFVIRMIAHLKAK